MLKITQQRRSRDVRIATAKGQQKARKEQKQTRLAFMRKVCQRSANLVLISLFTDAPWNWPQKLRLTGVLQYFAVSYFWVSLAVLATGSWDGAAARRAVSLSRYIYMHAHHAITRASGGV